MMATYSKVSLWLARGTVMEGIYSRMGTIISVNSIMIITKEWASLSSRMERLKRADI